ncbi:MULTISPECIES: hypothetical protein [Methanobacterium]|jgi:hypothetical protein|uniref:Uncharacterized protein n=1 Tax=Methanobacterium subterraneum TaxID=59277 RepID=A0A2H4V9G2_9EURY|nr:MULTISPECIES: hypothetical protein [Methanobacterium]MBW4256965.1 hypothetical protein [Methanobacterium sp. YSL]PKL73222.1 MAG: hypothetical protein CVV29_04645 [Methanobacteriales archaeon HGW-Methanobacteriales-2]AUB54717.1 hypothetical protein BK007_00890 [Methanobacterium subterraneum]AUB58306.1 hypothetical protein BK008_08250 [Methanobacterium sp. MZ-A1]AUB59283.1 hypothetical protein BK009_00435 [Methanobacterium subterraneum]
MFIKVRRDTLIILMLAFILITSGRLMSYMSYASSTESEQGIPIAGVIVKGNDIVPTDSIRTNIANVGFRTGSYIQGDTLITSKRKVPLNEALENARQAAMLSTVPGTKATPIKAVDVKLDKQTGILTVNVIEDFSTVEINQVG